MKIFLLLLILFAHVWGKLPVVVSILPQKTFVKKIGGDQVAVQVMVQPGSSPHTYEPKPSQMKQVAASALYLAIGVEFESVWLPKFHDLNPALPIIDISAKIPRRAMQEKDAAKAHSLDPHIWTSPANVRTIARNTLEALQHADPKHADLYRANCDAFLEEIRATDTRLHALLDPLPKGTAFMVMHPSWGYFADAYGLHQMPMEIAGKRPKPRELVALIKQARAQHVRAIFTQPEFSDSLANVLAHELHIPVRKVSPMAPDWSANLLRLAADIAGGKETVR
jgi:zinc transport system substrate-binding protein